MAVKIKRPAGIKVKRPRKAKNTTIPKWDDHEKMSNDAFQNYFRHAMQYYNLGFTGKELKPKVINWMGANGFDTTVIKAFKNTHDWRVNATMGGIAANLLQGMPTFRDDFNHGRDVSEWLTKAIDKVIKKGANDNPLKKKIIGQKISIQDRLRDVAVKMSDGIDAEYEILLSKPSKYDIKSFKALHLLREQEAKAGHARIIRSIYASDYAEMQEVLTTKDEQLLEAYSHLNKSQIKKILTFLREVDGACSMVMQEGKVARTPRAKKPKSKEKLIEKLNYKKADEPLKLVSINPMDIIGATELWVYNTKTRKIGRYVANNIDPKGLGREGTGLSIKGTTIIGYNENKSIQKTFRKPAEQVPEFMKCGKVKLRKFLDNIKAVDIKLNGRINNDIMLLRVFK